jgi:hypothetical protein
MVETMALYCRRDYWSAIRPLPWLMHSAQHRWMATGDKRLEQCSMGLIPRRFVERARIGDRGPVGILLAHSRVKGFLRELLAGAEVRASRSMSTKARRPVGTWRCPG